MSSDLRNLALRRELLEARASLQRLRIVAHAQALARSPVVRVVRLAATALAVAKVVGWLASRRSQGSSRGRTEIGRDP